MKADVQLPSSASGAAVRCHAQLSTRYPYDEERNKGYIEQEPRNCHPGRGDDALTIAYKGKGAGGTMNLAFLAKDTFTAPLPEGEHHDKDFASAYEHQFKKELCDEIQRAVLK